VVLDPGIGGNVGMPVSGIVAKEVVALAGQFIRPHYLRARICSNKLHVQHSWFGLFRIKPPHPDPLPRNGGEGILGGPESFFLLFPFAFCLLPFFSALPFCLTVIL
jgi:hypothetical protein